MEKRKKGRPKDTNLGNIKKKLSLLSYETVKRLVKKR